MLVALRVSQSSPSHGRKRSTDIKALVALVAGCILLGFVGAIGAYLVAEAGLTAETAIAVGTILLAVGTVILAYFTYQVAASAREQMDMLRRQDEQRRLAEERAFLVHSLATTRRYSQHLQRVREWVSSNVVRRTVFEKPSIPEVPDAFSSLIYEAERWRERRYFGSFEKMRESWATGRKAAEDVAARKQQADTLLPHYDALLAAAREYREVAAHALEQLPPEPKQ